MLLAAGAEPLPADRLLKLVWSAPPRTVRPGSVHVGVSRLRRWLESLPGETVTVSRDTRGYRLGAHPTAVDLTEFRDLVRRSGAAADPRFRCELLRAAKSLCRGPVLADLPTLDRDDPLLRGIAHELRAAGLALADAAMEAGRYEAAMGWLEAHVAQEPLDEPAHARLIRMLAADGQPAKALACHEQLRGRLADELGASPSDEVQQAYLAVLAADRGAAAVPERPRPRPHLLPPDIADFTGRDRQVQLLLHLHTRDRPSETAVPIMTITGRAGVGKTALAVHAGHLLAEVYRDGLLYAYLDGAGGRPADPADILGRFLRALGVEEASIPRRLEERMALYRNELAGRRVLVVLDDAAGAAQLRPLLPGSPSCGVLVTSRRQLTGLSARTVSLDVLDHRAALRLLRFIVGPERVAAEPAAADDIVRLCGALPLAIRIAGGRLGRSPHRRLRWLADRLADDRSRLDELSLDDLAVRSSLAPSYRALRPEDRRLLHYLGALAAPDIPGWAATAMADGASAAEESVDELVDTHLLDVAPPDPFGTPRYRLHDLVRSYARERADDELSEQERRTVLLRALTAWYVRACQADRHLPYRLPWRTPPEPAADDGPAAVAGTPLEPVSDPLAWFETERHALAAAVHQAHELGADELCWELASKLTGFYQIRDHYADWRDTHRVALAAATRAGTAAGRVAILRRLGELHTSQGEANQALRCFAWARRIAAELDDRLVEGHILASAGSAQRLLGHFAEARRSLEEALAVSLVHRDRRGTADARRGLGAVHREQGNLDAAAHSYRHALELFEALGDRYGQARVACGLGAVRARAGQPAEAEGCFRRALELSRGLGNRSGEAAALCRLGELRVEQGNLGGARPALERARDLYERVGARFGLATAWRATAALQRRAGDLTAGLAALSRALDLWTELDLPIWRARTLEAIGDVHEARGRRCEAERHWHSALRLYQSLDAPEAERLVRRAGRHHPVA